MCKLKMAENRIAELLNVVMQLKRDSLEKDNHIKSLRESLREASKALADSTIISRGDISELQRLNRIIQEKEQKIGELEAKIAEEKEEDFCKLCRGEHKKDVVCLDFWIDYSHRLEQELNDLNY